jgi:fluoroquinolone transport system permease protein
MSRLAAAAILELRVELRYRIVTVAGLLTAGWTIALLTMPAWLARGIGPFVLLVDTATFGAFFIAALFLFERGEGALAALSVSPLRFAEYLGVKVGALTALSVISAIPIGLAAARGPGALGVSLLGVAGVSVLFLILNFALVVRHRSLTSFLTVAPWPLIPLIAVPLAHAAGADHPAAYLVPTTGAADLIRLGLDPSLVISPGWAAVALGYLALAIIAAALVAKRSFDREFVRPDQPHSASVYRARPRRRPQGWLAAVVHIDVHTTLRSALLVIVLAGPILLAVALRFGYPPLAGHLRTQLGLDLAGYQPVMLASLVVLHVPLIIGMVGALLILDDIDDRTLLVLRVSPVTLPRYLAYRAVSVAVAAAVALVVTVPLSGLAAGQDIAAMLPALVLAAAQAPLIALATAAFARNKVEGLTALKLLGAVLTATAPAMWWLPGSASWALMVLPPYWTVELVWRPTVAGFLIGATVTALVTAGLVRRTLNRLGGQ